MQHIVLIKTSSKDPTPLPVAMKYILSSKFVLPFLVLVVTATMSHGQLVRGAGGQPWLDEDRCQKVKCPLIGCGPDSISVVPDGKCCPVCKPKPPPLVDCSRVRCARPFCMRGYEPVIADGQCCPFCKPTKKKVPDCGLVKCALPVCVEGYEPIVPDGKCCPVCKPIKKTFPDCSLVKCALPVCTEGYEPVVPAGKCCPVCKPKKKFPDCGLVKCAVPVCEQAYVLAMPDGECCHVCTPTLPVLMDMRMDVMPCPEVECTDPCYTYLTDQDNIAPMCAANEQCVTETVYVGGEKEVGCPATGCPTFKECL
jgi:hypothetical protein